MWITDMIEIRHNTKYGFRGSFDVVKTRFLLPAKTLDRVSIYVYGRKLAKDMATESRDFWEEFYIHKGF